MSAKSREMSQLPANAPATILVVDDTEDMRNLLELRVRAQGHVVLTAAHGREALAVMLANPVDLLLLDVMMPTMDGLELLTLIKQDASLRHVPVIMVSAMNELSQVARCISLGAEDYLTKPFNGVLLKARVDASLVRKRWHDQEAVFHKLLAREREESERLLLNILPEPVAQRLKNGERIIADFIPAATVLFGDLVGFTSLSTRVSPGELIEMLSQVFATFDVLAHRHGLEKIKTMGDAYMLAGGVPLPREDHALAVASMALDMQEAMASLTAPDGTPLRLRVGLHSGPLTAGVLGTAKFSYDVWGDTVNVASRLTSNALPGTILLGDATKTLLEDSFAMTARGPVELRGRGSVMTHVLTGRKPRITAAPG